MVYETRERPACQPRCGDPNPNTDNCDVISLVACYCKEGYVISGEVCVKEEDCGCEYEGGYYNVSFEQIRNMDLF